MRWPWVRRSTLEDAVEAERREVAPLLTRLRSELDAARQQCSDDLAAERALTRDLMAQLATLRAMPRPASETPLPTFPAVVRTAISQRAGKAKNYTAALDGWAREQLRLGVDPGSVANAVSTGEADSELDVAQEVV